MQVVGATQKAIAVLQAVSAANSYTCTTWAPHVAAIVADSVNARCLACGELVGGLTNLSSGRTTCFLSAGPWSAENQRWDSRLMLVEFVCMDQG